MDVILHFFMLKVLLH